MAAHSSILVWKIPWREKPGRLQSIGLQGVGLKRLGTHARNPFERPVRKQSPAHLKGPTYGPWGGSGPARPRRQATQSF